MRLLSALAMLVLLTGCSRSCKDDRPFVPYSIDAALPVSTSASASAPSVPPSPSNPPAVASFAAVQAEKVPDGSTQIRVDSMALAAPGGSTFRLMLKGDFDSDTDADVVAWTQSASSGALVLFRRQNAAKFDLPVELVSPPSSLLASWGCTSLDAALNLVGPHTVQLTLEPACADAGTKAPRARWIAFASPMRQPAARLDIVIDPAASDELVVAGDAADRDGDQFDDLTVSLSVATEPDPLEAAGAPVAAELHYFDRPAGLSRDPHEPEASLRAQLARLTKLPRKKNTLLELASGARRIHRLHDLVCEESGSAAVRVQGATISCGVSTALGDADLAELDALLRTGDILGAMAALGRLEKLNSRGDGRKVSDARGRIDKALGSRQVDVSELALPALPQPTSIATGALAFEPDGTLLVRDETSVVRVSNGSIDSSTAAPWTTAVTLSPHTLDRVVDPCDGRVVRAELPTYGIVPLPIPSLRGSACDRTMLAQPLGWGSAGLDLLVGTTAVRIAPDLKSARVVGSAQLQAARQGTPRSPDGRFFAVPSSFGLIMVNSTGKSVAWKHPRLGPSLRDCTASNGGEKAACVDGGRVLLISPTQGDGGDAR